MIRIAASSYSNTAPLVWSFLYGRNHGKVEIILDNAPARSAALLASDRVDGALVPVIAYQTIADANLVANVCVGARELVRSVCLVTRGSELADVKTVALDTSSKTSVALTKIIFREFLGFEPEWHHAMPNVEGMLLGADAALIIGDPALKISNSRSEVSDLRAFDLANLWHQYTGLGFIFAMWMTRKNSLDIDLAAARDEGLDHVADIVSNYSKEIGLDRDEMTTYLTDNIRYTPDRSMLDGMELYFDLAKKNGLIAENRPLVYV